MIDDKCQMDELHIYNTWKLSRNFAKIRRFKFRRNFYMTISNRYFFLIQSNLTLK